MISTLLALRPSWSKSSARRAVDVRQVQADSLKGSALQRFGFEDGFLVGEKLGKIDLDPLEPRRANPFRTAGCPGRRQG